MDQYDAVEKIIDLFTNLEEVQENYLGGSQVSGTVDLHFCDCATSLLSNQDT
ncbi:MAG: hypothetical protein VYA69_03470 [Gemmatimonadota bacterium]|nr:hypothetical protein [Gemmatimonadota bacterium]